MSGRLSAEERLRRRRQIIITDYTTCYHCEQPNLSEEDKFCPNCGFPQRGTQTERYNFILGHRRKKSALLEAETMVKRGRNFLFIVAGLNILSFLGDDSATLIIGLIISSIYIGLAFWSKVKPFPAMLTGLIVYVTLNLFFGILEPMYLLSGLIFKIAIIGSLLFALYSVKDIEKLKQEIVK